MDIGIKDIITLDNAKQYLVASKVSYKEDEYYYLININNAKDIMFCFEDEGTLVELGYKKLLAHLIPLLFKEARNASYIHKGVSALA